MKKILSSLLASTMVLSSLVTSFAVENCQITPSTQETTEVFQEIHTETLSGGKCGDDAFWEYDESTKTLIISGVGEVYEYTVSGDYDPNNPAIRPPWLNFSIETVVIGDGITKILRGSFNNISMSISVKTVHIGKGIKTLLSGTFAGCTGLTDVYLTTGTTTIEEGAFFSTDSIKNVYYEGSPTEFSNMTIGDDNGTFKTANWEYNSYGPNAYPDWATRYINYVSPEIMPDITTSNYDDASSRGLIAQCLYNLAGSFDKGAHSSFYDTGIYYTAITWCDTNNIMNGKSAEYFATNETVTREQFALILQQLARFQGKNTNSTDASLDNYGDAWSISSWAKSGMAWAVENGLMSGNNGNLNPHGEITRTEVAVMLYQYGTLYWKGQLS